MGQQTSNYSLPYPVLTDPPNVPADVQALAQAVDDTLTNSSLNTSPIGDTSNSTALDSDVDCAASSSHTLITATVVLTRQQYVWIGARAQFLNNSGSVIGHVGVFVKVDGSVPDNLFRPGWQHAGTAGGANERPTINIPTVPVLLGAGSHTITLTAERSSDTCTLTALSGGSVNSANVYPTYLHITV